MLSLPGICFLSETNCYMRKFFPAFFQCCINATHASLVELLERTISYRTTLDDLNCTWRCFASMLLICELGLDVRFAIFCTYHGSDPPLI
ncbi:hypothetical protein HETIRDRAFT_471809 [Heterobasidion irregulare TC 32-1]|uniref:Uncharacterized protein n=1 Tax=Heterobasidion irregulare (strain TC 32-1) TaxID=747525 RepID=W4KCF9_HETIT|nr:uncharacterized protein HETIRDRAFT_471809 [Heterobasidion irregulare TC 32-1]ETW83552.1 hypothetical protein HETIRDRAFT_471809 [Heterobasidion irregulare TC 32-1]